jgi:hypothetical protein
MRRYPGPGERKLTLAEISDSLLAEHGFRRWLPPAQAYRCDEPAVIVPMGDIEGPLWRGLNEETVRSLLDGSGLTHRLNRCPPIGREITTDFVFGTVFTDGVYRSPGFPKAPCAVLSPEEADLLGYV